MKLLEKGTVTKEKINKHHDNFSFFFSLVCVAGGFDGERARSGGEAAFSPFPSLPVTQATSSFAPHVVVYRESVLPSSQQTGNQASPTKNCIRNCLFFSQAFFSCVVQAFFFSCIVHHLILYS